MRVAIYSAVREGLPAYAGTVNHVSFVQQQEFILDRYAGPPIPEMRFEGVVSFEPASGPARHIAYRTRVHWEGHPDRWRILYLELADTTPIRNETHPRPLNPVLVELQRSIHDIEGLQDELRQGLVVEDNLEEWRPRGLAHEQEREGLLHKLEGEQASEQDLAPLRREVAQLKAQLAKAEDDRLEVRRHRQPLQGELARRRERLIAFLNTNRGKPRARAALSSDWLREQWIRWTRRRPLRTSTLPTAPTGAPETGISPVDPQAREGQDGVSAAEAQKTAQEAEDRWYPRLIEAVRELARAATPLPKR